MAPPVAPLTEEGARSPLVRAVALGEMRGSKEPESFVDDRVCVTADELREAVRLTLDRAGYLSPVPTSAPFVLDASLFLTVPDRGFRQTVQSIIWYKLTKRDDGQPIFKDSLLAICTLDVTDTFYGPERLRQVNECAVRGNLARFIGRVRGVDGAPAVFPNSSQ